MGEGRRPLAVFRSPCDRGLQITAWPQGDGGNCNFAITKAYYDKTTKEWKKSSSFFRDDLLRLSFLINDAYDWLRLEKDKRAEQDMINQEQTPESAAIHNIKLNTGGEPAIVNVIDNDSGDIPF